MRGGGLDERRRRTVHVHACVHVCAVCVCGVYMCMHLSVSMGGWEGKYDEKGDWMRGRGEIVVKH